MKTVNLNKSEATEALYSGYRLSHESWQQDEWVELNSDGQIWADDAYPKGSVDGIWWQHYNNFADGWLIVSSNKEDIAESVKKYKESRRKNKESGVIIKKG